LNTKLKRISIFFILCIFFTGVIFFIKNYHDNNIENIYINYVEDILIPKYGKSSLFLENSNNLSVEGEKLLDKDAEGILFYKIINLDNNSNKNLLIVRFEIEHDSDYKGSTDIILFYDLYTIDNKNIKKLNFGKNTFFENNKFYLTDNTIKNIPSKKIEVNLFIDKNKSSNYFCFNYTSIFNSKNDFNLHLKIFELNNNYSIDLKLELAPYVMHYSNSETLYKMTLFDKGGSLTFKNKTPLKNKCLSDSKKYGLDNLMENMFDNAENKSFTDISKLNNIEKIINITIK
jgi:hypothetical protein